MEQEHPKMAKKKKLPEPPDVQVINAGNLYLFRPTRKKPNSG